MSPLGRASYRGPPFAHRTRKGGGLPSPVESRLAGGKDVAAASPLPAPGARKDAGPSRRLKDAAPPERRRSGRRCSFGGASFLAPSFERWVYSKLGGWTSWVFSSELAHGPRSGINPARNWAGIVISGHPPRCRCRTYRRGNPCGRPPPNGATVRRQLLGHYRTGGGGPATQPGNDATPQGTHKGCPYGHRGLEVAKKKKKTKGGSVLPFVFGLGEG